MNSSTSGSTAFEVHLRTRQEVADDVVLFAFERTDGGELPAWEPGAHIDVVLPSGLIRPYSLCGDPGTTDVYEIAVLKETEGRGGSQEMHTLDVATAGLSIRGPRNHFPFVEADRYLFIGGGIGITPLIPMMRAVGEAQKPWRLLFGGRKRTSMAFVDDIAVIASGDVSIVPEDEMGRLDIDSFLKDWDSSVAIYCCGPEPLIAAVEQACARIGASENLHVERFAADPSMVVQAVQEGDREFVVELRSTGTTLVVPGDQSLLEVIRQVRTDMPFSCEEGFCGSCETRVLEGIPDHRDTLLTEEEKEEGDTMMVCVGRSLSDRLVLDL